MARRRDPKERTSFGTSGTEVANFLLKTITTNTAWADIEKALRKQFDITNWAIEARQPLQWLVNQGFIKEVSTEVYSKS